LKRGKKTQKEKKEEGRLLTSPPSPIFRCAEIQESKEEGKKGRAACSFSLTTIRPTSTGKKGKKSEERGGKKTSTTVSLVPCFSPHEKSSMWRSEGQEEKKKKKEGLLAFAIEQPTINFLVTRGKEKRGATFLARRTYSEGGEKKRKGADVFLSSLRRRATQKGGKRKIKGVRRGISRTRGKMEKG